MRNENQRVAIPKAVAQIKLILEWRYDGASLDDYLEYW